MMNVMMKKKCKHGLVCRKNKCKKPTPGESRAPEELLYDAREHQKKTPRSRWKKIARKIMFRGDRPEQVKKFNSLLVPLEAQGVRIGSLGNDRAQNTLGKGTRRKKKTTSSTNKLKSHILKKKGKKNLPVVKIKRLY